MIIMSLRVFEKQSPDKRGDCFALVSIQPRRTLGLLDQRARNDMWAKVNGLPVSALFAGAGIAIFTLQGRSKENFDMANPGEQPSYYDPELEALLAEAPADVQQTVRESIQRLQPILRPEEWLAIRRAFISDLMTMQEKKRLEQEHAEIEKAMQELEEGMKELRALQEGIEKLRKLEADVEKLRELEEGMEKLRELEDEMEKLRELKKRLDSLSNE